MPVRHRSPLGPLARFPVSPSDYAIYSAAKAREQRLQSLRALALILGSTWFIPVSCTTGVIVGVPVVTHFHERHMERGDQPHFIFTVVWQPGEAGEPFGYSRLAALALDKTPAPARSFVMAQPSGRKEEERSTVVTYKVLSSGASEQLIEVTWDDDKYGSVSRYRAGPSGVTPVFSRMTDPGYLF